MIEYSGYLTWDSEFFGKQIAFIEGFTATDMQIDAEIARYKKLGIDCVYLYTRKPVSLSGYDSVLADKKRIYVLENPMFDKCDNRHIMSKPMYEGHPSELYDLAFQSGEHSRFKVDTHFSDDEFCNLYRKWVDNSLQEGFADYVLVALDPQPVGFITAKLKGDRIVIGLFATDRKYRGRGIGSRLMQEIINEASTKKLKVEVVTQADNKAACDFYEGKGFKKVDEQYVYHIWL